MQSKPKPFGSIGIQSRAGDLAGSLSILDFSAGFEPTTFGFGNQRALQLRHEKIDAARSAQRQFQRSISVSQYM